MQKKIPMRQCIACRENKEKKSLIRVIRTTEGEVVLDKTGRMNGRGAYICPDINCFNLAKKKNAFSQALNVAVSDETYDLLMKEID